jgi:hypothetical protein
MTYPHEKILAFVK